MQRFLLGNLMLFVAVFLAGCAPAEVAPPPDAIPTILPGRSAPSSAAQDGATPAPGGRIPAAPK